jgi:hypothetical protein
MKYKIVLFLLSALCFSGVGAQVKQVTIIDDLETFVSGEGIIQITSDPGIVELIGIVSPEISVDKDSYVKINGYRIQVFMSNDSRTARKEITRKGNLIRATFPEIEVYQGYTSPNFKLLVGDFRTREEADVFRRQMQNAIPELGKEMYIVPDKVNIPVNSN